MTLLYLLLEFYSIYHKAHIITLLLQAVHHGNNANNHAIKYFLSGIPRQIELTFFHIMHNYNTIIAIITFYTYYYMILGVIIV